MNKQLKLECALRFIQIKTQYYLKVDHDTLWMDHCTLNNNIFNSIQSVLQNSENTFIIQRSICLTYLPAFRFIQIIICNVYLLLLHQGEFLHFT